MRREYFLEHTAVLLVRIESTLWDGVTVSVPNSVQTSLQIKPQVEVSVDHSNLEESQIGIQS